MVDKKRKVAATAQDQPQKKTRKASSTAVKSEAEPVASAPALTPAPPQNDAAIKSKTSRKRAADFLDDGETTNASVAPAVATAKPAKKSKKSAAQPTVSAASKKGKKQTRSSGDASLTADGVNGVIEHSSDSEVEIATGDVPVHNSLLAEGLHTADKEVADNSDEIEDEEDSDQGAALLTGFDSDTEDNAEDTNVDLSRTQPIPDYKKTSKKLRKAKENGSDGPGAVYVGRIPHGFYEQPMREYFSQFGDIKRLRLSRNRKTGASKHFAFIEFESNEVAKIVAETMDNYLMFGHILKCKYAPAENLHPDVWKGANKKFRKIPHDKLEKQRLEAPKTVEQWEKKNAKEQKKREKQGSKLKAIGYEIESPALKDPSSVLSLRKLEQAEQAEQAKNIETQEEPAAAIEGAEPAPEAKAAKKSKGKKKAAADADATVAPLTEDNLDIQNADNTVEKAKKGNNKNLKNLKPESPASTTAATNSGSIVTDDKSTKRKKSKLSKVISDTPMTDSGDLEALSSIAVGDEAVAQEGMTETPTGDLGDTVSGVADAELKKRKSDRKGKKATGKSADALVEENVANTAPAAQKAEKKAKADAVEAAVASEKKPKGILKKAKKQKV